MASSGHGRAGRGGTPRRGETSMLAAVADRVGVSRTTVSNAYNRPDQLSVDVRERILRAAAELGYNGPNAITRASRAVRAGAVGLIFTERLEYAFSDSAAVAFLHGLAEACSDRRRSLLLVSTESTAGRSLSIDSAARAAVDGFVIYSMPSTDPDLGAVLRRSEPTVIVDAPHAIAGVDFVGIDDRAAFASVSAHVLRAGHAHVGVVVVRRNEDLPAGGQPMTLATSLATGAFPHPVRQQRLLGLSDAVQLALIDPSSVLVAERSRNSRADGAAGAGLLLDTFPMPTAILCTSDVLALGVLDELARRGLRVGVDVAVTGFDDVAAAEAAQLTTVRQPMRAKGRAAIEALLDRRHRARVTRVMLPTELIVRASTGGGA